MEIGLLQLVVKKRLVYRAIAFIWILIQSFGIVVCYQSTDIIAGTCVPWGAHSSYAAEKAVTWSIFFVQLLLPATSMVFCYSRIIYALAHKVHDVRNGGHGGLAPPPQWLHDS